jgi:hypothetical protein
MKFRLLIPLILLMAFSGKMASILIDSFSAKNVPTWIIHASRMLQMRGAKDAAVVAYRLSFATKQMPTQANPVRSAGRMGRQLKGKKFRSLILSTT